MKIKSFIILALMTFGFALNSYAYEVWHTPSGKSYEVYTSLKVGKKGKDSGFYIVSFKTDQHLDDRYALLLEYYDILTQLYHFHLPKKVRDDKFSVVTVEAFRKLPKSKKDKTPSRRFTKKLSEIKKIVKNHRRIDWNRLKAFQAFNDKKYKKAIGFFNKVKNKVPHDHYQTANAFLLQGDRDNALKNLNKGIKKFPNDITLLNNLAMTTMLKGTFLLEGKYEYDPAKMEEAKKVLSKALKLDNKNWLTKSNMAVLETTVNNFKSAEKYYLDALKVSNNSAELSYRVASFYHGQKQFSKAEEFYNSALTRLKGMRTPASEQKTKEIQDRLKLVKAKKTPK